MHPFGFSAAFPAILLLALLAQLSPLAGCAGRGPAVDFAASAPGLTPETYRSDLAQCQEYAGDTDLGFDSVPITPGGSQTMGIPGMGGSPGNAPGISSGTIESPLTRQEPRNETVFRCLKARGYSLKR